MFQDRPNYWDAWGTSSLWSRLCAVRLTRRGFIAGLNIDVEIHHLEKRTELKFTGVQVVAEGPLRASVETQVKYGNSTINVTVRFRSLFPFAQYIHGWGMLCSDRSHWMLSLVSQPDHCVFVLVTDFHRLYAATLKPDSRPLITFSADVDWRERHEFLKCTSRVHFN